MPPLYDQIAKVWSPGIAQPVSMQRRERLDSGKDGQVRFDSIADRDLSEFG